MRIKHVQRYSKVYRPLPLANFLYISEGAFDCALIYFFIFIVSCCFCLLLWLLFCLAFYFTFCFNYYCFWNFFYIFLIFSFYLFICISVSLSLSLSVCLSVCLSLSLSLSIYIYIYIYIFMWGVWGCVWVCKTPLNLLEVKLLSRILILWKHWNSLKEKYFMYKSSVVTVVRSFGQIVNIQRQLFSVTYVIEVIFSELH